MGPDFVTPTEACQILGCHKQQLYRLRDSGYLPNEQQNGNWVLARQGLEEAWANRPIKKTMQSLGQKSGRKPKSDQAQKKDQDPRPRDSDRRGAVPDYNVERAWTEYEKNRRQKMENDITEGLLVFREDFETATAAIYAQALTLGHAAAKQIKLQIPDLTMEQMLIIEKIVLNVFEQVSVSEFEDLPE